MTRLLDRMATLTLVWLLVIVIAVFALPRLGGWRFDAVMSGSMEPAIATGGIVCIRPTDGTKVNVGDIIAYRSGEALIVHRVVRIDNSGPEPSFLTKGDANEAADVLEVPASKIAGTVVFDLPYAGYVVNFVHSRLGFLLAIFIPGSLIILLELVNIWRIVLGNDKPPIRGGPGGRRVASRGDAAGAHDKARSLLGCRRLPPRPQVRWDYAVQPTDRADDPLLTTGPGDRN
ncbi:MAG: signal peptidase I [Dehalococcoidia bacterium]|nr:signal peptidase I [Dehalococcoidia bacterium]